METATALLQSSAMTKLQKLAALLVILGAESASELLRNLDEQELEAVSAEMARLTFISQELQQEILREFTDVAVAASAGIVGGPGYAKKALEQSVGPSRASDIIRRVAPAAAPIPALEPLLEMDPRELFNLLKQEQPQTIALLAAYLSPEKSSRLLALMPPALRDEVVERLAMMGPTPVEVIERVVQVLSRKAGPQPARVLSQTGGVRSAAALLNSLEKNLSQSVLRDLEKRNPELGHEIRQKMFTFEDLILLGPSALQKIMREIDLRDLALSLKTASGPAQRHPPFRRVQTRAAETVQRGNYPCSARSRRGTSRPPDGAYLSTPCAIWKTVANWISSNRRNTYRNELLV